MPDYAKVFQYEEDGLVYTVSLYDENGSILADVTVLEGFMDVNAIYHGDEDFSGKSENLGGPLNMNGSQLDGEKVQWDGATEVSDPGLGPDGEDKESFLAEGDTLTVTLNVDSLDEIDVIGIRATSTSTEDGSIKGVSDDPEEPEDPEDPVDPLFDKVFFGNNYQDAGEASGFFIQAVEPDPNTFDVPALPEGTEPTFDNYVDYYVNGLGQDVTTVEAVVFFNNNADGNPEELFRIEAPEGGFSDTDALLLAYDDVIDAQGDLSGMDLMAALSLDPLSVEGTTDTTVVDDGVEEEIDII